MIYSTITSLEWEWEIATFFGRSI